MYYGLLVNDTTDWLSITYLPHFIHGQFITKDFIKRLQYDMINHFGFFIFYFTVKEYVESFYQHNDYVSSMFSIQIYNFLMM